MPRTLPEPTQRTLVALSGSLHSPSRTTALLAHAADLASRRLGLRTQILELSDFLPSLGLARSIDQLDPIARARLDTLLGADAMIIGTPVYKGSYTGLLKHLFDLIEPAALFGKPLLLAATGGGEKHALVIEHQLRPLLGFFEAATLPTGVYASTADFDGYRLVKPAVIDRLTRAVDQFAPYLTHHAAETDRPRPAIAAV